VGTGVVAVPCVSGILYDESCFAVSVESEAGVIIETGMFPDCSCAFFNELMFSCSEVIFDLSVSSDF